MDSAHHCIFMDFLWLPQKTSATPTTRELDRGSYRRVYSGSHLCRGVLEPHQQCL